MIINTNQDLIKYIISLDTNLEKYYNTRVRHYKLYDHTIIVSNEFEKLAIQI